MYSIESIVGLFLFCGFFIMIIAVYNSRKKSSIIKTDAFFHASGISTATKNQLNKSEIVLNETKTFYSETDISTIANEKINKLETAPEFENEIPLTVDVVRPVLVLDIDKYEDEKTQNLVERFGEYDPTLELYSYKYPTLDLLRVSNAKVAISVDELEVNKSKIIETLNYNNIKIDKIEATVGPIVTLYEITPSPGMRISKIKGLEGDIALRLTATGIRITSMPVLGTIGIEVPNKNPEIVSIHSVLSTDSFLTTPIELPIVLGKTLHNKPFVADLTKMPHLLIAGTTGQGKSIGINAILVSLLYKKHPAELKLILIDIRKLELTLFRKIERHFLASLPDESDAIITDIAKATNTLKSLLIELNLRTELLQEANVRNIQEYNSKFINRKISDPQRHRYLPFIVLIIEEFADLVTGNHENEELIAHIARQSRPVGIHLIISTQKPSVNTITGDIKANFSSRLAFRVSSKIDSMHILDKSGAEKLKGNGDMLFSTGFDLIHLQCPYIDTEEVERVVDFIGNQRGYPSPMLLPEYINEYEQSHLKEFDLDSSDPLFEEAARLIVIHQQGSTSLI